MDHGDLQTGIPWEPPEHMVHTNFGGAVEHVAKNFAAWVRRLARALVRQQEDPSYVEARRKRGAAFGQHGLTRQEVKRRSDRDKASKNYFYAMALQK